MPATGFSRVSRNSAHQNRARIDVNYSPGMPIRVAPGEANA